MAANLSERDLLLLSNFTYFRTSPNAVGMNMGVLIDEEIKRIKALGSGAKVGGDISADDAVKMLEDMQNSPNITKLRFAKYDTNIEAMAFEVPGTGEAVIAFQGTGGTYDRWKDNATGLATVDTAYRQGVERFSRECSEYSSIVTTGHSKGGHGAEHFAVVSPDNVSRVVSYDGYGMSPEYKKQYAQELARVKGRIVAINGDNDYIQGIDSDIAGEKFYIKDAGHDFKSFHRSSDLYFAGEYDASGNFAASCKQNHQSEFGIVSTRLINSLIGSIRFVSFPGRDREVTFELVGIVLAQIMSGDGKLTIRDLDRIIRSSLIDAGLSVWAAFKLRAIFRAHYPLMLVALAAYAKERLTNKKVVRVHKVPAPQRDHKLADAVKKFADRISNQGMYAGNAGKTVYSPQTLDLSLRQLGRLRGDLSALASQVQSSRRFASWRLGSLQLSGGVACRVQASNVGHVYAGQLSAVLSNYSRLLNAYSDEIARLSQDIDEVRNIFETTERGLISLAQSIQVG